MQPDGFRASSGNHLRCCYVPTNYPSLAPSDKLVRDVTLLVSGGTNLVAKTGRDGTYDVCGRRRKGYASRARDSPQPNAPTVGVTTVDLSIIRRHILNITPLDSPYKLLAADVNGSDTVTTLDISLIRKMILGSIDTFPAGTWRFVPADHVFPRSNETVGCARSSQLHQRVRQPPRPGFRGHQNWAMSTTRGRRR